MPKKRNKYNTKKVKPIYNDITFDSQLELNIYKYLDECDDITIVKTQPQFLLVDPFSYYCLEKDSIRKYSKISYTPDIQIKMNGLNKDIIVEVKGLPTPVYMLRKKLWYLQNGDEYYFLELRSLKACKIIFDEIRNRGK